jgi:hypothetical protein
LSLVVVAGVKKLCPPIHSATECKKKKLVVEGRMHGAGRIIFFGEWEERRGGGGQAAISISWDGVTGVCGEISSLLSWELGGEKMGGIVRLGF